MLDVARNKEKASIKTLPLRQSKKGRKLEQTNQTKDGDHRNTHSHFCTAANPLLKGTPNYYISHADKSFTLPTPIQSKDCTYLETLLIRNYTCCSTTKGFHSVIQTTACTRPSFRCVYTSESDYFYHFYKTADAEDGSNAGVDYQKLNFNDI